MLGRVGQHFPSRTERGSENVALGMGFGIFQAHHAALDEPANVGMIAREAGHRVGADQVETTVTYMRKKKLAAHDGESGACGSHALQLGVLHRVTLNVGMSSIEGRDEGLLRIGGQARS